MLKLRNECLKKTQENLKCNQLNVLDNHNYVMQLEKELH